MAETPKFIQGVYSFRGAGLERAVPLQPAATHKVPFDKRAQLVYLRAGNSSGELVYLALKQSGKVIRLFPLGAKGAIHVPLAIVEDIDPEAELELCLGATEGSSGSIIVDLGLVEL
ncbi:MAG: molybdopterin oxidoreductase [Polyangiaceae bacterium]